MRVRPLILATILFVASAAPARAIETPGFVDEASSAGIDHSYTGGWEYFVGGGVAAFDCSGDGFPDLYFAGGSSPASLYRNAGSVGGTLAMAEVADSPTAVTGVTGAYPLDIDGDGIMDLAVLRVGGNILFRGLGGCRFEAANDRWDFDGGSEWTVAFSAIWEEGQSLPTLAFGNYVDRNQPGSPFGTCHDNTLHRPASAEGYGPPRTLRPGYCALSMLFSDWNRDSVPDLRISNDRQYYRGGQEQLWLLPPGGTPRLYGRQDGWRQLKIWGMGIASYDMNGDGYPEYFLTSMADNKLQTLTPQGFGQELQPAYDDIAFSLGATVHRPYVGGQTMPSTAWHAEFDDVNNDGFIDLFVAKGNVEGMTDFASRDPNNLLIGQADGSFQEGAPDAGIVTFAKSRGGAVADLNLDGLLDLVVVNRDENVELWRNLGAAPPPAEGQAAGPSVPMGNWSMIRLEQPGPNRHGVGSWVEVKSGAHIWRREISVGGGHAGDQAGWIHFGVGTAERLEIRIQWPDGAWGPWVRTFSNQFLLIRRNHDLPLYWMPPQAAG